MRPDNVEAGDVVLEIRQKLCGECVTVSFFLVGDIVAIAVGDFVGIIGDNVVTVGVEQKIIDVFDQKTGIGSERIDVIEYPGQMRLDVIKALEYLGQVGLNTGQMLAVVEDPLEYRREVGLERIKTGEYRGHVGQKRRRGGIHKVYDAVGVLDESRDDPRNSGHFGPQVIFERAVVALVVRAALSADAVEFADEDLAGGEEHADGAVDGGLHDVVAVSADGERAEEAFGVVRAADQLCF